VTSYIFSNGSSTLVEKAVKADPELSRFEGLWNGVYITASESSAFKPSRQLYDELVNRVVVGGGPEDVWLVTANPFDVVGARAAGLNVAWVDRESKGWVDRLGTVIGKIEPTVIVKGVDEAVNEIIARATSMK
jgi:2-haloacid dehalogenase